MSLYSPESNDPTLVNQETQGQTLTAISDRLGAATSAPAENTINFRLSTLLAWFGAATAAPAANTLLARLQRLVDSLTGTGTSTRIQVNASWRLQNSDTAVRSLPVVGTTQVTALVANPNRKGAFVTNRGTGTVYLSPIASVSSTGHRYALAANASANIFTINEPYTGAWVAIATTAGNNVEFFEYT